MADAFDDFLARAPKAELHLHLEGAFDWPTVRALHPEGGSLPESPPWLADGRRFASFDDFRDVFLKILRPSTGTPEAIERHTDAVLRSLAAQGVRHVEPIVGPRFHMARGLPVSEILDAFARGRDSAVRATGIRVAFVCGVNRHYELAGEAELLRAALDHSGPRGRGLFGAVDLQGDDRVVPGEGWKDLLDDARARGLRVRVHAGELGGAASVRHALDHLGAQEISHGIGAAEDPGLLREVAARGTWLHVCPTSNVRLRAVPGYREHPLPRMLAAGCRVTLNTDDPLLFGPGLLEEYRIARRALGLAEDDLHRLLRNGFLAARMPEEERGAVLAELEKAWPPTA